MAAEPGGLGAALVEIGAAIRDMPTAMRKLALMSLFQCYAMQAYWNYVIFSIGCSVFQTTNPNSSAFHSAVLVNGQMAAWYNGVAFAAAFALVPLARHIGAASLHAACLVMAGMGMLWLPHITSAAWLFAPAVGIGIGWASMMGNPYVILAGSIPPERTGVYMGIFNMMIVIPMPLNYKPLLSSDPRSVLTLCGCLLFAAAASVWWVRERAGAGLPVGATQRP